MYLSYSVGVEDLDDCSGGAENLDDGDYRGEEGDYTVLT